MYCTAPVPVLVMSALSTVIIVGTSMAWAERGQSEAAVVAPGHHDHAAVTASKPQNTTLDYQRDMDIGMARMMTDMHSPGYSGNVDVDFLAMMIPHHEGAVDMARLVLLHGRDPTTRQLAEEIIATQTIEVQSMTRRLSALRRPDGPGAEFPSLGGLRGPESESAGDRESQSRMRKPLMTRARPVGVHAHMSAALGLADPASTRTPSWSHP